ncbi:MAG: PAS domain S-box protein [Balneolaceae bacterium]|nr:PAS domain S-box protein [Balneolaceae bacterium]
MTKANQIFSSVNLDNISVHVLNALDAHIAILDETGMIVAFNKKWKSFNERTPDKWTRPLLHQNYLKMLQKPISEGQDYALRFLIGLKAVLNGEKETFEIKYPAKTTTDTAWFKATVNSLTDEKGIILIHEDVTSVVNNQKSAKETRQKFEHQFENSLYGILLADEDNRILEANSVATQLLKASVHDLTFSNLSRFLNVGDSLIEIQRIINKHGNFLGEHHVFDTKGNQIPVELSVSLYRNERGAVVSSWSFKDITERIQAKRELERKEQQYRMQFNNTLEGTIIGCPDGFIIEANPAACDILGYATEELAGKHRKLIIDESTQENQAALSQRAKKSSFSGEVDLIHKQGDKIRVKVNSVVVPEEDGMAHTIMTFSDISDKKKTELELKRTKHFNELAVNGSNIGLWEMDLQTGDVYYNEKWFAMLGYKEEDIKFNRDFFYTLIHPDDYDIPEQELQRYHDKRDQYETEFRLRAKDGSYRWILAIGKYADHDEHGEPRKIAGSHLDITKRKKMEADNSKNQQLLNQLFQNSPIGIVQIDKSGKVIKANPSFERIFGYNRTELIGNELDAVIAPKELEEKAVSLSSYTLSVEKRGEIISSFGMYMDITERKNLENQIIELLQTEQKARIHMEDMFEEAPSAIAMLKGKELTFSFVNNTYKKLVGLDTIIGKKVAELHPELEEQGLITLLQKVYEQGESMTFKEKEVYINRKGKQVTLYLDFVYKPLFDDQGKVYGIFFEAVNVTEQVKARKIIEQSLAEKGVLLNEVHHRVKNNLAIVTGLLELESMSETGTKAQHFLNVSQSRISTIAKVHELLYKNDSLSHVKFDEYIQDIICGKHLTPHQTKIELFVQTQLEDVSMNVNQAIPAALLLNEIINQLIEQSTSTDPAGDLLPCIDFTLREVNNKIQFHLLDNSKQLLKYLCLKKDDVSSLRKELMDALLRQLQGEMEVHCEEEYTLTISFNKKNIKGAHNALDTEY